MLICLVSVSFPAGGGRAIGVSARPEIHPLPQLNLKITQFAISVENKNTTSDKIAT